MKAQFLEKMLIAALKFQKKCKNSSQKSGKSVSFEHQNWEKVQNESFKQKNLCGSLCLEGRTWKETYYPFWSKAGWKNFHINKAIWTRGVQGIPRI